MKKENIEKDNIEKNNIETLNILVNNLYDVQKVRIGMSNRNQALQEKDKEEIFGEHVIRLKKLEKDIVKEMKNEITRFPISAWLLGHRGIGPSLAGQIIAIIRNTERFGNVSKLWSYSGMATMEICTVCKKRHIKSPRKEEWTNRIAKRLEAQHNKKKIKKSGEGDILEYDAARDKNNLDDEEDTNFVIKARNMLCSCKHPNIKVIAQRRIKNTIIDYNPKMKKLCRNIALSLVQYNQIYGDMYKGFLQTYMARDDLLKGINTEKYKGGILEKIKEGKAAKMARRKMVKIFLQHLWITWRNMEGLPVTKPYIFDIKGHSNYIEPPEVEFPEITDAAIGEDDIEDI